MMGGGEFSLLACAGIFFCRWKPLHEFFSDKYCFSFEQWNLDSLSMFFVLYKLLFYTHNRSKDTGHFLTKIFSNMYTQCTNSTFNGIINPKWDGRSSVAPIFLTVLWKRTWTQTLSFDKENNNKSEKIFSKILTQNILRHRLFMDN